MSAINQSLPLSENQRGLWHLQTVHPDLTAYNTASVFRLRSCLDIQQLQRSLQQLVAEQPLLRTTFPLQGDTPYQVVHEMLQPTFDHILLPDVDEAELRARVQAAHECPFDLSNGPLVRLTIFSRAEDDHVLLLNFHHILLDFGSQSKLTKLLFDLYTAALSTTNASDELISSSDLAQQTSYADFVTWQQTHLSSSAATKSGDYWAQQLQSPLPVLDLPTDRPLPRQQTFNGDVYRFVLPGTLSQALTALARSQQVTPFALILTAFAVLLARYSRQDDLIIGIPSDERVRTHQRFQHTLGHLINLLPIRVNLADQPTFVDLVKRIQTVVLGGLWHQHYPFVRMVQDAHWLHDPSRSPLFDVTFNMPVLEKADDFVTLMEGTAMQPRVYKGLQLEPFDLSQQAGQVFLNLDLWLTDSSMVGFLQYNSDLFEEATIARMAGHFAVLLNAIVQQPDQPALQLSMLTASEYHQIVHEWNDTTVDFGESQTMHAIFEQQVARTPDAVAVSFYANSIDENPLPDETIVNHLTYAELNEQVNGMAHLLVEQGVGPDVLVALYAERSPLFLIAMLAIFKAGGVYLPLDPRSPSARLTQVLIQSKAPLLLTSDEFAHSVVASLETIDMAERPRLLHLTELQNQAGAIANLPIHSSRLDLAYVIYTSGSTGLPKGAMIEQQGMVNHLYVKIKDLNLVATDRVAQTASQAFDISVWQFLAALVVGGSVHIYPDEIALNPDRLLQQVEEDRITIWETVPSLMRAILESLQQTHPDALEGSNQPLQEKRWSLAALRWLIPTGEALPPTLANQWLTLYPQIPLLNAYGPTECSDDVTHYPIDQPLPPIVVNTPIGRPVCNMRAYILDRAMQPTPVGVLGELWIGGIGVGRGYLYDAERTAAAFIPDPFDANNTSARLYKTGDLARWQISTDGMPVIEFLGRADFQVKIRGFRVELGEIENALLAQADVREAVVLVREDTPGDKRLVAYLIGAADQESLRKALAQRLPGYMIPAAFVVLNALPLTPNGKTDRRALPAPNLSDLLSPEKVVHPRTPTEIALAQVWSEVLRIEHVGIHDNFFQLGGHSLIAIQVIARLRAQQRREVPLRKLFDHSTIAALAHWLDQEQAQAGEPSATQQSGWLQPVTRTQPLPLSFNQEDAWFLRQSATIRSVHQQNSGATYRLRGKLNVRALQQSINTLIQRHEILRTIFVQMDNTQQSVLPTAVAQLVVAEAAIALPVLDFSQLSSAAQADEAARLQQAEQVTPLDLTQAPALRVKLIRLGSEEHLLLLTIHHITVDAWSMGIFWKELSEIYRAAVLQQPPALAPLTIQYADFAHWQRQYFTPDRLAARQCYWQQFFATPPTPLHLQTDYPRPAKPAGQGYPAGEELLTINHTLVNKLTLLSQQHETTLAVILLAAYATTLYAYSGCEDVLIFAPSSNRNQPELESLIGYFTGLALLRIDLAAEPDLHKLIARTKEVMLAALTNQDLSLRHLLRATSPDWLPCAFPEREALFNFTPGMVTESKLPDLTIAPEASPPSTIVADLALYLTPEPLDNTGDSTELAWQGSFHYRRDLFEPTTIRQMVQTFECILEAMIVDPTQQIAAYRPKATLACAAGVP